MDTYALKIGTRNKFHIFDPSS